MSGGSGGPSWPAPLPDPQNRILSQEHQNV